MAKKVFLYNFGKFWLHLLKLYTQLQHLDTAILNTSPPLDVTDAAAKCSMVAAPLSFAAPPAAPLTAYTLCIANTVKHIQFPVIYT